MSEHVPGYGFAKNRKSKFCHGFGVFQLDLQFFKTDPDYFPERCYERFSETLGKALRDLISCQKKRGLQNRTSITDFEFCTIAITYNTGRFRLNKGLKQGTSTVPRITENTSTTMSPVCVRLRRRMGRRLSRRRTGRRVFLRRSCPRRRAPGCVLIRCRPRCGCGVNPRSAAPRPRMWWLNCRMAGRCVPLVRAPKRDSRDRGNAVRH